MSSGDNNQYDGFTPEQQQYLVDLISSLDLQTAYEQSPGESQEASIYGTPFEDLCKEETTKYETHPWDIWNKMEQHNDADKMPEGIDVFMFKHHGVFNVAPAMEGYMCRLRIPGCKLRGDQLGLLGDLAENVAGGYAHVTTRGNLQVRQVPPGKLLELLRSLYEAGLTSRGSGADSVRNITLSPSAGFDPTELTDLMPYALKLHHHILNSKDLHGIPRKFNISFDNGGSLSCVSDTNDIAYLAVNVLENDQSVEPGLYCRILLGGITGHLDFARDTGVIIKPEETVAVSNAMLRVFIEHGDRTNRKKARLKYVLDQHGFDWFLERTQEKLDELHPGVKLIRLSEKFDAPRNEILRKGHIGLHKQKQEGLNYLGITLSVGLLKPEQMRGLGRIAQKYGKNDIRLTVWQNLIIPHIKDEDVSSAIKEIEELGLSISASSFAAGAVACTGKWACKFGAAYTKQNAATVVAHLQSRFHLDQPINIHLTGCAHSCAQHYIGDIGLLGSATKDGRDGYQVFLGGGSDNDQGIARQLCGAIAAEVLPAFLENIVRIYLNKRDGKETFLSFTRRHSEEELKEMFLSDAPTEATVAA